jgi:hypothetical protein
MNNNWNDVIARLSADIPDTSDIQDSKFLTDLAHTDGSCTVTSVV